MKGTALLLLHNYMNVVSPSLTYMCYSVCTTNKITDADAVDMLACLILHLGLLHDVIALRSP